MATYLIGDVQGCFDTLLQLLEELRFDSTQDRLWFAGDLINRGPRSLDTLRFVRDLGESALTVLGNHDLHLLAVANGHRRGRRDTLDEILAAPDREALLDWLRHRPLLHVADDNRTALVHAGLPPQWSMDEARSHAAEVEQALQGAQWRELLAGMYGNQPDCWSPGLRGLDRLRFIINCCTRLRYCSANGRLDADEKGAPGTQPASLMPWFAVPGRRSAEATIVFGHWSTLGRVHWPEHDVYGLDTGCVWGGRLTALRLEDRRLFSIVAVEPKPASVATD